MGARFWGIYQDDKSLKVETLVGYLIVDRAQVVRIVDNVITEDTRVCA